MLQMRLYEIFKLNLAQNLGCKGKQNKLWKAAFYWE